MFLYQNAPVSARPYPTYRSPQPAQLMRTPILALTIVSPAALLIGKPPVLSTGVTAGGTPLGETIVSFPLSTVHPTNSATGATARNPHDSYTP